MSRRRPPPVGRWQVRFECPHHGIAGSITREDGEDEDAFGGVAMSEYAIGYERVRVFCRDCRAQGDARELQVRLERITALLDEMQRDGVARRVVPI